MSKQLISMSIQEFAYELASDSPAPGGGSASALAAALGSGLVSMVASLTKGKKKYEAVEKEMIALEARAQELLKQMLALIDEDTVAFNKVMKAYRLPKDNEEEKSKRRASIALATKEATEVPLKLARSCVRVLELALISADKGNKNALSDAGVAAGMAEAAYRGATYNVRINLPGVKDSAYVETVESELKAMSKKVEKLSQEIYQTMDKTLG